MPGNIAAQSDAKYRIYYNSIFLAGICGEYGNAQILSNLLLKPAFLTQ